MTIEPVTHIEGLNGRGSELFIKAGSTINLTCIVEDATDNAPKHILWRHNSRIVNFEWARGGMSLITEKKSRGVTVSRLLIQKAVRSDSGTYQCAPQNAHPAYVKIHVLEQGEKQAAMQSASSTSKRTYLLPTTIFLLHFLFLNTFSLSDILSAMSSLLTLIPLPSYISTSSLSRVQISSRRENNLKPSKNDFCSRPLLNSQSVQPQRQQLITTREVLNLTENFVTLQAISYSEGSHLFETQNTNNSLPFVYSTAQKFLTT